MRLEIFNDFQQLSINWPTLSRKWDPTGTSVERKGDVIEVVIASCMEHHRYHGAEAASRRRFLELCGQFYDAIHTIMQFLCDSDGRLSSKCLPHPYHFPRLLIFVYFSRKSRDYRHAFAVKANEEMHMLQSRVGCYTWCH